MPAATLFREFDLRAREAQLLPPPRHAWFKKNQTIRYRGRAESAANVSAACSLTVRERGANLEDGAAYCAASHFKYWWPRGCAQCTQLVATGVTGLIQAEWAGGASSSTRDSRMCEPPL